MKNIYLVFTFILFCSSSFCQKFSENNSSLFSDSLVTGTWLLKEIKFVKSAETPAERSVIAAEANIINNSNADTSISQLNSNIDLQNKSQYSSPIYSESDVILNEKKSQVVSSEQFLKNIAEIDSIIFRYRIDMPEDSVIIFNIMPDYSFVLGSKSDVYDGRWQLDKSVLLILINERTNLNEILFLDSNYLIIQNITDRNVRRMYFEKIINK